MKQKIITGLKKKLLLVELPEGAYEIRFSVKLKNHLIYRVGETFSDAINLEEDNYNFIGKLTDIKEEEFTELVERFNNGAVRNYKEKIPFDPSDDLANFCLTAKESFFSKLEADGIYFKNQLGETPVTIEKKYYKLYPGGKKAAQAFNEKENNAWQEAQSKVWDKNRCWLAEVMNTYN
jgi:hypothetical protein